MIDDLIENPKFASFLKILAVVAGAAALAGIVMKLMGLPYNGLVLVVGFSLLSVVAFFLISIFPYPPHNDNMAKTMRLEPIWNFAMKMSGMSLAVLLIGVLFTIMRWPDHRLLVIIGLVAVIASGALWIYYRVQESQFGNR